MLDLNLFDRDRIYRIVLGYGERTLYLSCVDRSEFGQIALYFEFDPVEAATFSTHALAAAALNDVRDPIRDACRIEVVPCST